MGNSIFVGDDSAASYMQYRVSGTAKKEDDSSAQGGVKGNSIYAGDIFGDKDVVSQRFALKQKEAVKRVLDQFKSDMATDDEMKSLTEHAETLGDVVRDTTKQISGVDERRAEIKERYEITPDSQEQKDLELMQKANEARNHPFDPEYQLTDEEQERYDNLPPVTAYQQEMLECDEEEKKYRSQREKAQREAVVDMATVHATEKALLKVTAKNSMVGAQADAADMMKSALKDMVSSLMDEGVEKVDEDMQQVREDMEEGQAEALEKKIELEKMKEEDAEKEEVQQEMQNTVLSAQMQAVSGTQNAVENLQANIKSLVQDQIMLDVDMKGLRVDQQV